MEKVVAWINRQKYHEWTKHDKKLSLRKLVQYAKIGSCGRKTPLPPEVSWIDMKVNEEKDARVTPESLIKPKDFGRVVKETENARDEALMYVLFEAALRPGEILMMDVGSVEFKERYCLIAVNGKTGIKRIPLVVSYRPLLKRLMDECKDKGEAIGIWKDTPSECWSGLPPKLVWAGGGEVESQLLTDFLEQLTDRMEGKRFSSEGHCLTSAIKLLREWQVTPNRVCLGETPTDAIIKERHKIYERSLLFAGDADRNRPCLNAASTSTESPHALSAGGWVVTRIHMCC